MLIVVGGMIGLGKSSVAEILGEHFKSDVFYESVDDNPILPLFYSESEEEIQKKRYPFLLQLYFLNTRFKSIKEALVHNNNVLDRSIYEDWYFAKKNMELGRINDLEMKIYEDLLHNMLEELEELPKKAPDVMVYLKGSFETVLNRIALRGREFEIDDSLKEYYHFLWKDYDAWVENCYNASEVLIIDMDNMDVVNNEADKEKLIELVEEKLREVRATEEIA
ncbi:MULTISPECIES: deoxynucleoside kinase [Clostridium]|uniref:deoxynucleoside kinase n=1 Tax=Clostridium TaxID=1485 RepID=UPI0018AB05B2|nr:MULTISPECIES: deoxynucleoside kinase [Clostridium]MDB1970090.1 deoxynucleoside kinase [Clostridium tertium]MDU2680952.1 deoxynucleoside kinase [Clostridium sp.]MDU7362090.1 deoxynucleoside kinase [Clostridium sp.]